MYVTPKGQWLLAVEVAGECKVLSVVASVGREGREAQSTAHKVPLMQLQAGWSWRAGEDRLHCWGWFQ